MSTTSLVQRQDPALPPMIPLLQNGDRLTREEFHRRYEAMPQVKKAELIEGVGYMPSPVRHDQHGKPHVEMACWLAVYRAATPGVEAGDNSSLVLDMKNMPQPDALLMIRPEFGGQVRIKDGYIVGGPELIVEICASTASYDLHDKLIAYRRNAVKEYLVWRVEDEAIDWFVLRDGQYEPLLADSHGIMRSQDFPGLWLDLQAMLAGDLRRVLEVLPQGTESAEHEAFVRQLEDRQRNRS